MPDAFTTKLTAVESYAGDAFDAAAQLHTAEHAVAVYDSPADYNLEAMMAGYQGGTILSEGSAQVGVAYSKRVIMIAARGSSQPADWRDDLLSIVRVGWVPYLPKGCRVGFGFRRQAKAICPRLLDYLRELLELHPDAEVIVTGHSLGAALVPLIVAYLAHHGIAVRFAVAHESPRVGSERFAAWYDQTFTYGATTTWSIVNVRDGEPDIVTRVPKRSWGFRHHGRRVVLDRAEVLFGHEAWQRWRADNPVPNRTAAWRIITRLVRSTAASMRAHFGSSLLASWRALQT